MNICQKKITGRLAARSEPKTKFKKVSEGQSVNVNSVSQIQWGGTSENNVLVHNNTYSRTFISV